MGFGFRNIVRVLTTMIVMLSCTPDPLDVHDIPALDQKIVVSSQMIPGQAVAVLLTKSIGALDASDNSDPLALLRQIIIADADVRIANNGTSYPLTYLGNGLYGAVSIPLVAGQQYTLYVNSPEYGAVTATTIVKPLVSFEDVSAVISISGRDTLADVSYSFHDETGRNWYMVNAQHITREDLEERVLNPRITTKMIDDQSFDGGTKQDQFKILFDEVKPGDTLAVMLSNIDEDYYNFMKLREDTRFGLAAAIGEPINYPSNVKGGLGFFNLYVPDVRVFTLDE
jgi:uncharacterized membrane protein